MRANEIYEAPKPPTDIDGLFRFYFKITPNYINALNHNPSYSIDNNIVNVDGCVTLRKSISKLPIKFGEVTGDFNLIEKKLQMLDGCPEIVGGQFVCQRNFLKSLNGGPKQVKHSYLCQNNGLTTLDGVPKIIGSNFDCSHNPLTSLDHLPTEIGHILILPYNPNIPLLKVLFIKGLKSVDFETFISTGRHDPIEKEVKDILNNYLGKGRGGALACAAELARAGYKGNVRL